MTAELTFFSWPVPEKGFSWVRTNPLEANTTKEDDYLTSAIPLGVAYGRWHYNPLAETGLFRNFAELPPSSDAIRKFANKYGALGGAASVAIAVKPGPAVGSSLVGTGESIDSWKGAIWSLREMVSFWDAVQNKSEVLAERILWDGTRAVSYKGPRIQGSRWPYERTSSTIASEHEPELLARFQPGELKSPAMHYLQGQVNKKLTENEVTARLLWDPRHTRLGLHIVPRSLLGCMWLQLARAIDGDRGYRRCPDCRKWFEATSHVTRADRIFCSPSCKASAHRKKIAEARTLLSQGRSSKDIARQLETTVEKVKRWTRE